MLLYALLAGAAGLLLWRRLNPDVAPGGGFGSSDADKPDVELGIAPDGTFVLVEVPKFVPGGGGPSSPMPPNLPPQSFAPPGAFAGPGQPSVSMNAPGYDGKVSVGHVGARSCTGEPPSCAPGRDCCDDCRSGKISVGFVQPGTQVVPVRSLEGMAQNLARRMAAGDVDAMMRAKAILELALERGDAQARFVAECVTRSLDAYRTPGGPELQRRVRVAIDDPNITNGYEELAGMGRSGIWNG